MEKRKKKNWALRSDMPLYLQGPSNNRWGGHQRQCLVPYRQNTFGPASVCKVFTKEERERYVQEHGLQLATCEASGFDG